MDAEKRGVEAMVQAFVLQAGGDVRLAEICQRAMAQEEEGGVCLPVTAEEAEWLKASPLVSSAPDAKGLLVLDGGRLYTRRNWDYERLVRERVAQMVAARPANAAMQIPSDGVFGKLKECQREAIRQMGNRCFTIMTGGPGTGKTYTIARAVKLIKDQIPGLKLGLAAPTGKAAARVKEAMDEEAKTLGLGDIETSTLHRLLDPNYDFVTFKHSHDNPLDLDWLIVDEASMVSLSMMAKLLDALPEKCRLTLVGDAFQLSSVEPGRVFGDLCKMKLVRESGCLCELTESSRFKEGGEIATLAGFIKAGDAAKALGFLKQDGNRLVHYHCLKKADGGEGDNSQHLFNRLVEDLFADFCSQGTAEGALDALNRCRILCAVRKGTFGCEKLNDRVRRRMQRNYPNCPIPWMITRNDRTLDVSNGDVGVVMADDRGATLSLPAVAKQDGGEDQGAPWRIPLELLPEREMAFASTIHKAQGSEYRDVVIVLPPASEDRATKGNMMLTRELLYTALTRTKGEIHLFADDQSIEECCRNETKRNTGLE